MADTRQPIRYGPDQTDSGELMRHLVLTLLLLPLLGACSEPDVKEPTTSATPSTSSTPKIPPPTIPPQAKEDSPEGAVALASAWVQFLNFAAVSGRTSELKELSAPTCLGCSKYVELVEKTYADGGYYRDNPWSLSRFEVESLSSGRTVYAHVRSPGGTFKASTEGPVRPGTREDGELVFRVDTKTGNVLSLRRRP